MEQFNCNNNNNNNSGQQQRLVGVEDITNRLDRMNVDMVDMVDVSHHSHHRSLGQQQIQHLDGTFSALSLGQQHNNEQNLNPNSASFDNQEYHYFVDNNGDAHLMGQLDDSGGGSSPMMMTTTAQDNFTNLDHHHHQQQQLQQQQQQNNISNIIIVTNVDSAVFSDKLMQSKFEALFLAYDPNVTFRYLKSFRRVRLDFETARSAEMARSNLTQYRLGNTEFKCYSAQIIRPNNSNVNDNQGMAAYSTHLNIPKLTKQFLISPPASPPVGWEPVNEGSPCIDVQLISAIANLVPGKTHEIHAGNESQPGIYVEVCEDVQFADATMRSCQRIPRTMSPGCCQPTTTTPE